MSNSTESTSTDTTADQCKTLNKNDEHLRLTFAAANLDSSAEEVRLLRLARIADLEHPKDMAKAEVDINQLKGKIATNQLKKEKLEGEVNGIKQNIKLAEELLRARIAKFECAKDIAQLEKEVNGIKGQQKATADHFCRLDAAIGDFQSKVAAEQEHQKLADADATLQTNVVKLEEDQNKQQQNIAALTDGQQKLHTTISELEHAQKNDREEIGQKMDAFLKSVEVQQRNIDELQKSIAALTAGQQKLHTTISDLEHAQKNDREEIGQKMDALLKSVKEHQKPGNADATLQNKFVKMEEEQKKQQQNIDKLQKVDCRFDCRTTDEWGNCARRACTNACCMYTSALLGPSLPSPNRWNRAACHAGLTLFESNRLIVQRNGSHCEDLLPNPFFTISRAKSSSVFAEVPISRNQLDIFYYEQMPLGRSVGQFEGNYAYEEDGTFWGHALERCRRTNDGIPFITDGIPAFCAGDVVGCGLKFATRQIFYTKNGRRLDSADLFATSVDLFPCVTLCRPGDKIEANFGPNFIFKVADVV
ncbi:hypothetical protein GPALN_011631 [Globodera pallida]|nr:hypothetical protein GPALN_011631 [Globodera pallida]